MRFLLAIGLSLLVTIGAAGADKPIPQDTARMEARRREKLTWLHRTCTEAYDKVGKKDARWDKLARVALDLSERQGASQVDSEIALEDIQKAAKAAIVAGCDDPFLLYMYNRTSIGANSLSKDEASRRLKASGEALGASRYPGFRRARGLEVAGTCALYETTFPSTDVLKDVRRTYDAAVAMLSVSAASDERNEFWEERWIEILGKIIQEYRTLGDDALTAHRRVDDTLAKIPELKVLRLQLRGIVWNSVGWEARTTAFASKVPDGGFEKFEKCQREARKAYEEAWRLRPGDARTAGALLEIEKSIGGDRGEMEKWFERAMQADGDDRDACWTKLEWLDPKWHGTPEEMLAFGRRCRDTKNWRAGIPLLFCDAHLRYLSMIDQADNPDYLASPALWPEIAAVFDEHLKHHPDDDLARNKYAVMCWLSRHSSEAHAQFNILGNRLAQWKEFPCYPLSVMKQMREAAAVIAEQEKANKRAAGKPKP